MKDNEDVELYYGKPNEPGNQDGIVTSAWFHSPMALRTWDQLWFFVTLEISLSDLLVTLALLESCHVLFFPMRSCLTSITTEGSQEKRLTKH